MTRVIVVVIALAAAAVAWSLLHDGLPDPPSPDLTGREPQVAERLAALREAIVDDRSDRSRWFEYGRCLQSHELFDEALVCYGVAAADAKLAFACHHLTGILLDGRDDDAAEEAYARAVALRDDYVALHLRRGNLAERTGRIDDARRHFRRAVELDAGSSHGLLGLGRIALAAGDAAAARARLEAAVRAEPRHQEAYAVLAAACRAAGDERAAQRYARKAERLAPGHPLHDEIAMKMRLANNSLASYLGIARAAVNQANPRPRVALRYADLALALRDDLAAPHYLRGRALYTLGRLPEALESLQRVIAIEPENVEALGNAAGILLALERRDEAMPYLKRAHALDPDDSNTLYLTSLAIWRRLPGEAEAMVRRALEADPEDIPARLHLATILAAVGRLDDAEKELRTVLRNAPGHPRATEMLEKFLRDRKNL